MKDEKELDLAIIGAGAAGLTAGLYAARSKLNTLIFENGLVGGQIRETFSVENFPGFTSISGSELADKMQEQTIKSGVNISEFENIEKVKLSDQEKIIETDSTIYNAKSIIIATGSKSKRLPVPEEEKLHGKCIHYCELCDGAMYEGKDIIVVGGGNSAIDAALFLTKYAKNILVIHHSESLKAQKINQDELFKHKNVTLLLNTEITHVIGDNTIKEITAKDKKTGETKSLKADGIFVYVGNKPQTDLFKDSLILSESGHIKTNEKLETNIKGVFAAGDVREKEIRQLTTAVNDGSIAALMAEKYIKSLF